MAGVTSHPIVEAIVARFGGARRIVEVGVGRRCEVARALAEALPGARIVATDRDPRAVRSHATCRTVRTVLDDALAPDPCIYVGASVVYAREPPADLLPALQRISDEAGADLVVAPRPEDARMCLAPAWVALDPHNLVFMRPPALHVAASRRTGRAGHSRPMPP